jgi:hypothetical protein
VTGAGGSIGAELSRQLAQFNLQSLVLLDRYENTLFELGSGPARTAASIIDWPSPTSRTHGASIGSSPQSGLSWCSTPLRTSTCR